MTDSSQLNIPESVKQKYPKLVDLIIETKSMDDDERQYWFNILPIMKAEQVEKLRKILITEKSKIAEIDAQYANEVSDSSSNFDAEEFQKKKENLARAEHAHETKESELEDELLREIENL